MDSVGQRETHDQRPRSLRHQNIATMYTRQLDCCLAHVYFTIDYYDDKGVHTQRQRLMGVRVGVVIQSAAAD